MFRDPKWRVTFDRPSNCLGIRSFIVAGWNFRSGAMAHWGFRVFGICLEVEWHWMSEIEEEAHRNFFCSEEDYQWGDTDDA